jgi:GDP-4-dehydro-6-deoxy-D-mannose reductase
VKVLVTGAGGFVGQWLVPRLIADGHDVVGALYPATAAAPALSEADRRRVRWIPLDLRDQAAVDTCVSVEPEAVIHLAALASGAEARRDPGLAWEVNAVGTVRLAEALGRARTRARRDPLLLLASTGEVYGAGRGTRPRTENDPLIPCSPYAASKLGAEVAAFEAHRRTGLRVVIARAFPHTGPGQSTRYVIPAFAERLRAARRIGAPVVKTGNLEPVRDFLDVRDVVEAYVALLERGQSGQVYNVAGGTGCSLVEIFHTLAKLEGIRALPEVDPDLARAADIPHLVGDATKLRKATGWEPRLSLNQTLKDIVDAQKD